MKRIKVFDDLKELNDKIHEIELTPELKNLFKGHVSLNGGLILSSFLPKDLQNEFYKYVNDVVIDEVNNELIKEITNDVNKRILEQIVSPITVDDINWWMKIK